MIKATYFKRLFFATICIMLCSCSPSKKVTEQDKYKVKCRETVENIEKGLFLSCPISRGPNAVIAYLEKIPAYYRNNNYDYGNGSVRFNAKNASFFDIKLIDDKSLFLLNYCKNSKGEEVFLLFQAIYYFENEEDKNLSYSKILDLLKKELGLIQQVKYDISINSYLRYNLPCRSGINLKQTKDQSDKYFIDIVWAPNPQ